MSESQSQLYRKDLADIHIEGYGFHWRGAAPQILDWLAERKIDQGTVVDLGCGGGEWLAYLAERGYQTCGIDVSPSMIRAARKTSPTSQFLCSSFVDADIPKCDAVTSLGEPLNYLNSGTLMRRTIERVYRALRPGGLLIFDVRYPPKGSVETVHYVRSDEDWFCHSRIEEDDKHLTRYITTFRRTQGNSFRRDEETHRLKLFPKAQMLEWLRKTGFKVRTYRGYGEYELGARQGVFVCCK